MARSSIPCDQMSSYMDGINVKIAEAYKPPRKVTLPAAYNNKFPEVMKNIYDFSLEKSVLEKLAEWKNVRNANSEACRIRLEEKIKRNEERSSAISPPPSANSIIPLPIKVAQAPENTILTPQLLLPHLRDLHNIDIHAKTNGLDYSDFDNDTSSPFDNVELKTINDMEELAQVLQPTSQWNPPIKIENSMKEMSLENYVDDHKEEKRDTAENKIDDKNDVNSQHDSKRRNISIIVQELQKELARPYMKNWKPWPDLESPELEDALSSKGHSVSTSSESGLSNPIADLSENDQDLAKYLSDMGFSLSRAARAINDLGGKDNKEIVEYLLSIQSLEKSGFSANAAEKALALNQYNPEEAKKYLDNLTTLKDLGFSEEEASKALLSSGNDQDKAIDFLCP